MHLYLSICITYNVIVGRNTHTLELIASGGIVCEHSACVYATEICTYTILDCVYVRILKYCVNVNEHHVYFCSKRSTSCVLQSEHGNHRSVVHLPKHISLSNFLDMRRKFFFKYFHTYFKSFFNYVCAQRTGLYIRFD